MQKILHPSARRELIGVLNQFGEDHVLEESGLPRKELRDAIIGKPVRAGTRRALTTFLDDVAEDDDENGDASAESGDDDDESSEDDDESSEDDAEDE